jgi:hypothetical protein
VICKFGIELIPENQNVHIIICQTINKESACRFHKWCNQTNSFIICTDKLGNSCPFFEENESTDIDK